MSQKKAKQERANTRPAQSPGVDAVDAMQAITVDNTLMGGLRLGGRAVKMIVRRPFASLLMVAGLLGIWLPVAAILANLVAVVLMGGGSGREAGLAFGFVMAMWLLAPVFAIVSVETALLLSQRARVRWRVALASFACEKGLAWLVIGSLVVGLGIQAAAVAVSRFASPTVALTGAIGLLALGLFARITIFLASTHLWAGQSGGPKAIAWAVKSIPRVLCAWASAMMVMLAALIILLAVLVALGWLVMLAGSMGSGVQVAISLLILWPILFMTIGGLLVIEGRIMLGLHALALAGPGNPRTDPRETLAV